ncbi:hypothetical protein P2G88_11400 [Aliiglaciecola sp. CAU 1673]|uniref:hypothetical protein n=1 Tax=Aliiglaciecola sp. CAU 1673 TaxID=3032595 RepID=UPI0023DB8CCB|nr:hypothetical protein [Aliiglaciecola sp. CAU 1673]MDF2178854.1 hypothetical protein [Aliiglaciecola sp. CAU 1673]
MISRLIYPQPALSYLHKYLIRVHESGFFVARSGRKKGHLFAKIPLLGALMSKDSGVWPASKMSLFDTVTDSNWNR